VTSPVACAPTPVLDRYNIFAGVSADAGGPSSNTYLGTAPARLYSAQPGALTLYTNLNTPCDGSSGAGQLMTFTIQLTASFS
jgi:hypothetical protein